MKNLVLGFLGCIILFTSCDPDVPGENITLPEMKFGIKVYPDTAYLKLGDTVTISTSISKTLSNGVTITDGKATIGLYLGFTEEIPYSTFGMESAKNLEHIRIIEIIGNITYNSSGSIGDVIAIPFEDSIKFIAKIIPQKKGTYGMQVSSKFFEGSQGKTRTRPHFDMPNHHFDELWDISGEEYYPGDFVYDHSYLFSVYE